MHTRLQGVPSDIIRIAMPDNGKMWICKHYQCQRNEPFWFLLSERERENNSEQKASRVDPQECELLKVN